MSPCVALPRNPDRGMALPITPYPAVLARPRSGPFLIDPHAAVGGLIEAFDEVLNLGSSWPWPPCRQSIIMARWKCADGARPSRGKYPARVLVQGCSCRAEPARGDKAKAMPPRSASCAYGECGGRRRRARSWSRSRMMAVIPSPLVSASSRFKAGWSECGRS
jgi:hypothetical protein